jgi:hypothetical protein
MLFWLGVTFIVALAIFCILCGSPTDWIDELDL